ncbi:MAG: hypothetical protein HDR44_02275 [Allobaculum sp.]|nr:hypothetical protein [Allobaculum sp.]
MFQAFFKWGLCFLSAFSSPLLQVLQPPTPLIEVQARGPGEVRLHYGKQVYSTNRDEVLQLHLPYQASIQIEAIADDLSRIETLQINEEELPQAKYQTTWTHPLILKEALSIQATFSPSYTPSNVKEPPDKKSSPTLQNLTASLSNSSFPTNSLSLSKGLISPIPLSQTQDFSLQDSSTKELEVPIQEEKPIDQEDQDDPQKDESFLDSLIEDSSSLASLDSSLTLSSEEVDSEFDDSNFPPLFDQDFSQDDAKQEEFDQSEEPKKNPDQEEERKDSQKENDKKEDEQDSKEDEEDLLDKGEQIGYVSSDLKVLVKRLPEISVSEVLDLFETTVEQVQSDCQQGYEANWIYLRATLAKALGLLDQIDQEAYLPEALFEENSNFLVRRPQAILLQKSAMQPIKRQVRAAPRAVTSESVSVVSSMLYKNISIFGNYISNYIWILSNNQHAFCASYLSAPPKTGALASSVSAVDNAALRKVLYYGFAGPENSLLEWSTEQQIIITNDLVSLAFSNTCISQGELNGKMWRTGLKAIWDRIQSLPDPQNYQAYIANFPGTGLNHLDQTVSFQPLAFGRYEEPPVPDLPPDTPPTTTTSKPALQLLKTTSDEIISNTGQQNYSLIGAKYEVRQGSSYAAGSKIATLTIGNDLSSEVLEVDKAGTYWAKEIQAPKGFALNPTAYRIEVPDNCTAQAPVRILVYDAPQYCPVDLLAKKVDGQTNQPLANAIFKLQYYAIDPSTPSAYRNANPIASWTLKSDAKGEVKADLAHIYQADYDFPRPLDNPSLAVFPIGVVTLQEIQAPSGYALNDQIYAIGLKPTASNTTQTSFQVYNAPTIENRPAKIHLVKTDINHAGLPGAEFSVKDPKGNIQVIALDQNGNGEVIFDQNGTWTIWESKAPEGYALNTTKAIFTVAGSSITADCPRENAYVTYVDQTLTIQDLGTCYGLKVLKTDPSGVPLANAVFDLYTIPSASNINDKTLVTKATTDGQGIATFGNLEPSKLYVLLESQAPEGYILPQHSDGTKPEYLINVQASTSSSQTTQNESGYIMVVQPYNLTYSGQRGTPSYLYSDKKTHGFSWIKENDLVTITFESVNEPLEGQALPHTGSQSVLQALGLGTLLVILGLKRLYPSKRTI